MLYKFQRESHLIFSSICLLLTLDLIVKCASSWRLAVSLCSSALLVWTATLHACLLWSCFISPLCSCDLPISFSFPIDRSYFLLAQLIDDFMDLTPQILHQVYERIIYAALRGMYPNKSITCLPANCKYFAMLLTLDFFGSGAYDYRHIHRQHYITLVALCCAVPC